MTMELEKTVGVQPQAWSALTIHWMHNHPEIWNWMFYKTESNITGCDGTCL
jgi:hypothetical protein